MNNKLENLQGSLMELTGKIQSNKYISAISYALMSSMGVLIAGTVLNILANFPVPAVTNLLSNIGLLSFMQEVVLVFQLTAPITCLVIAYKIAEANGVDVIQVAVAAFMNYMLVVPSTFATNDYGQLEGNLAFGALNSENMMTAIIVGIFTAVLFSWAVRKNFVIKLPDTMPPFVQVALSSIPAAMITVVPFIVLRYLFALTPFVSLPGFIYGIIAAPLMSVGNSLGGHLLFLFLNNLVWFFGIHNAPVSAIAMLVTMPALTENITAVMSGQPAPNLLSLMSWMFIMQLFGGSCSTIGLAIDTVLFAKSDRYKAQGKVQFVPSLFNVMEPIAFGMPLILNPIFLVPMTLGPTILYLIFYAGLKLGLYGTPIALVNAFLPGFIQSFFMGGGVGLGILSIVLVLVSCVIWLPFLLAADKNELKLEQEAKSAE